MLSAVGRGRAVPVALVGDDAADQRPAGDEPADIGERIPANRQRPEVQQHRVNRWERQEKHGHRLKP